MNFRRKIVCTVIGCTLILALFFTVISIVNFNSQNASAAPRAPGDNAVAIKIKINHDEKTFPDSKQQEENAKESIKNAFENAIRDNTDLRVVPYNDERFGSEWKIYYLINQKHGTAGQVFIPGNADPHVVKEIMNNRKQGTVGMSITLSHNNRFVMNHIKAIPFDSSTNLQPFIDDMIEVVLNVIQQKMKNKDAPIIFLDKSTIAN